MKNKLVRAVSILLSAVMLLPCARLFASAAVVTVSDPAAKAQYLSQFNYYANGLKTLMPYLKMTTDLRMTHATTGSRVDGEELDESGKKYLAWLLDACIVPGSGMISTYLDMMNDVPRLPKEATFVYGEKRDQRLPFVGKSYVSALNNSDNFILKTEKYGGTLLHPENEKTAIRVEFPRTTLDEVENSSLDKIFELPNISFDAVMVNGNPAPEDADGKLSELKFDEFAYDNAYAQAVFDNEGRLLSFTESIDYIFELSLYDALRLLSAYAGIDWVSIAIGVAEGIFKGLGDGRTGKDILKNYVIYVTYTNILEITDINWTKRLFGDTDNNGKVDAYDARAILRHSVGRMENVFENQMNEIYSDIDFDGLITTADARLALRMSVNLDPTFVDVPDGKEVQILFIGDVVIPDDPIDPDDPVDPDIPVLPDDPGDDPHYSDLSTIIATFTQSIIGVIQGAQDENNIDALRKMFEEFKNSLINL